MLTGLAVITDRVSMGGSALTSVCPTICFHSVGTDLLLTLTFGMGVRHDHDSQGIEGQGQGLLWLKLHIGSGTYLWTQLTFDLPLLQQYTS